MHGHGPAVRTFLCAQTAHTTAHRAFGEPTQAGSAHTHCEHLCQPSGPAETLKTCGVPTASLCGLAVQSPAHPISWRAAPAPPLPPKNRAEMKQPLPSAALSPTTAPTQTPDQHREGSCPKTPSAAVSQFPSLLERSFTECLLGPRAREGPEMKKGFVAHSWCRTQQKRGTPIRKLLSKTGSTVIQMGFDGNTGASKAP